MPLAAQELHPIWRVRNHPRLSIFVPAPILVAPKGALIDRGTTPNHVVADLGVLSMESWSDARLDRDSRSRHDDAIGVMITRLPRIVPS